MKKATCTAMKRFKQYFILLFVLCFVVFTGLFLFLNHEPEPERISEENMKSYTLSGSKLYVPCEILSEDWTPNSGNVSKTVVYTPSQDQIVDSNQQHPVDRTSMNLELASSVPTDNQSVVDQYFAFLMGGMGNTDHLISTNIEYHISDGETVSLVLNPCVWFPSEITVYVGLYSTQTEMCYAYPLSLGIVDNTVLTFSCLPKGDYRLYASPDVPGVLTSGHFYGKIMIKP